jgi:hypothetical protein
MGLKLQEFGNELTKFAEKWRGTLFNLLRWFTGVLNSGNSSFTIPSRSCTYPSCHKRDMDMRMRW